MMLNSRLMSVLSVIFSLFFATGGYCCFVTRPRRVSHEDKAATVAPSNTPLEAVPAQPKMVPPAPLAEFIPPDTCGTNIYQLGDKSRSSERQPLVRGEQADSAEIPWQAMVLTSTGNKSTRYLCGGVVVDRSWVLTNAMCILGGPDITVVVGTNRLHYLRENTVKQVREVSIKHLRPLHSSEPSEHDVALLRLDRPLNFDNFTQPICLPSDCNDECSDLEIATVSGWGRTSPSPHSPAAESLRKKKVVIIPRQRCQRSFQQNSITVDETTVCAGVGNKSDGTCYGDRGAPLTCALPGKNDRAYLMGIKTDRVTCGQANTYSRFTRICKVRDWIDRVITGKTTKQFSSTAATARESSISTKATTTDSTDLGGRGSTSTTETPDLKWINHPNCGVPKNVSDTADYRKAREDEFPWQVRFQADGQKICSGALITRQWILTAAHCVTAEKPPIILGAHRLTGDGDEKVEAAQLIKHPNYKAATHEADIALIKLKNGISYRRQIRPICLLDTDCVGEAGPSGRCVSSGWGNVAEETRQRPASTLMTGRRVVLRSPSCEDTLWDNGQEVIISDHMTCAGYHPSASSSSGCQIDSGGPLVCATSSLKGYYLHGIATIGYTCSHDQLPDVFTRVCTFMPWIRETIKTNGGIGPRGNLEKRTVRTRTTTPASI